MRATQYENWLQGKISARPIRDNLSRCHRVERQLRIDLDAEYLRDGGETLVEQLDPSRASSTIIAALEFAKGADTYNGISSLRSAVKKYFEFCAHNT